MTRILLWCSVAVWSVGALVGTASAETRLLIATASTGGTWYPLGGGLANLISKYIPDTSATAKPSGASVENIRNVANNRVDIAIVQPDAAHAGYLGSESFRAEKKYDNLRALFATYPIESYMYAMADSGIKTMRDLKGKRVAVGAAGSGTEVLNRMLLEQYGITYDHIDEKFLSAPEATEALKDGTIDAGMYLLGTPAPTLMDLATQRKVQFLSMEPAEVQQFVKKYPYYEPSTVKAGTYKDQTKDFTTIAYYGIFIVNDKMSDKLAYDIVKTTFDHLDELGQIHVSFKDINLKTALKSIAIPLHPGAEKFYREKGLIQ